MKTRDIRKQFLDYFRSKGHSLVPSSPVLPHQDPTLLFTNAGMNQFKDIFLGKSTRDFKRAVTCQKCIRAGGKHNDLENVGHTSRHLTFFEMLGNFSFGDYFKEQAIDYAWEVSTKIFGFDEKLIYPSVFETDDEAFKIWTKYVPASRITRFGEADNFWSMGETGPCGPSSELYYDRGEKYGTATNPRDDTSGVRFLEFWNLVFMQYNRTKDGILEPLPQPSIDTGSGLERVMSIIENTDSIYETDILRGIIQAIEEESKITYDMKDQKRGPAFRVIADHIRSLAFAIGDGVIPSNIDRGYVLRKILRRAVRYGKILGFEEPFLAKILPRLVELMGEDYKELISAQYKIAEVLTREEVAFLKTLKRGGNILNQVIETAQETTHKISGADAFKLKDTYGLPIEEILLIAKDSDLLVDVQEYDKLEQEAKIKSKAAKKEEVVIEKNLFEEFLKHHKSSSFIREDRELFESKIIGLISNGEFVKSLNENEEGMVIIEETPFYPEMGGQVGDTGILANDQVFFEVLDCKSPFPGIITHIGKVSKGTIEEGMIIKASIDTDRRRKIQSSHTATHLLHWALHKVLGDHARQAGSVVEADRLRFDFSHHNQLTDEEIRNIEKLVNEKIRDNIPLQIYEISYEEAQKRADIKQFFGEKYGSTVRVVDIDFSKELCGGTHTSYTGNIGYFRIARESGIAAGVRRIEAVTGEKAELFSYHVDDQIKEISHKLKTPQNKLLERIDKIQEELKTAQTDVKQLKKEKLQELAKSLIKSTSANGIPFCVAEVSIKQDELKTLSDELIQQLPTGVIALGTKDEERAFLLVKVSQDLVAKKISANDLIKQILPLIAGNGGGKGDFAQGSGTQKENLFSALNKLISLL